MVQLQHYILVARNPNLSFMSLHVAPDCCRTVHAAHAVMGWITRTVEHNDSQLHKAVPAWLCFMITMHNSILALPQFPAAMQAVMSQHACCIRQALASHHMLYIWPAWMCNPTQSGVYNPKLRILCSTLACRCLHFPSLPCKLSMPYAFWCFVSTPSSSIALTYPSMF